MKNYERRLECWQCLRCDHLWTKRPGDRPVACPSCTSVLWATNKVRAPGAGRKKKVVPIDGAPTRPIPQEGGQNEK